MNSPAPELSWNGSAKSVDYNGSSGLPNHMVNVRNWLVVDLGDHLRSTNVSFLFLSVRLGFHAIFAV